MDSEYLGAWDFPQDRIGTIVKVEGVTLPGNGVIKANHKPILHLKGTEKKLIVNATIGKTIAGMYGPNTDDWVGKRITLYATTCNSKGGQVVDCVRVRPTVPKTAGAPIPSQPVDEAMRAKQLAAAESAATEQPRMREPGED